MIITFNNIKISTSPFVYTPGEDSFFLEDVIRNYFKKNRFKKNSLTIAEMGCGSGYISIILTKILSDLKIYAIDINQHALDLTLENMILNICDISNLVLIKSDLFSNVENTIFDAIIFNSPYLPPENMNYDSTSNQFLKLAWEGGEDIVKQFLVSAINFLSLDSIIIVVLSNYQIKNSTPEDFINQIHQNLYIVESFKKKLSLETLHIVILKKRY
jgi:HemK-related putative methylase